MNERIELVSSGTKVRVGLIELQITPGGDLVVGVIRTHASAINLGQPNNLDISALIDCLNCFRDTGSFAALADTSAVPYTGKRMRDYDGQPVTPLLQGKPEFWQCWITDGETDYGATRRADQFLPLTPPAPKCRAYTPEEAAAHLGRWYKQKTGCGEMQFLEVGTTGVRWNYLGDPVPTPSRFCDYKNLAENFVWVDDGTPCGILETAI